MAGRRILKRERARLIPRGSTRDKRGSAYTHTRTRLYPKSNKSSLKPKCQVQRWGRNRAKRGMNRAGTEQCGGTGREHGKNRAEKHPTHQNPSQNPTHMVHHPEIPRSRRDLQPAPPLAQQDDKTTRPKLVNLQKQRRDKTLRSKHKTQPDQIKTRIHYSFHFTCIRVVYITNNCKQSQGWSGANKDAARARASARQAGRGCRVRVYIHDADANYE
jgi:hypothetical protein